MKYVPRLEKLAVMQWHPSNGVDPTRERLNQYLDRERRMARSEDHADTAFPEARAGYE